MPDHPPNTSDASDNPTTTDAATEEIVIDDIEAEAGFLDDGRRLRIWSLSTARTRMLVFILTLIGTELVAACVDER